jgi:ABC-type multidrug transport system ATPase subunit
MPNALDVAALHWWYKRGEPVLEDLALEVPAGTIVSLSGPNGSGKSTLLRLIAGVVLPRAGRISRAPRVGYLPQSSDEPPVRLRASAWLRYVARMKGSDATDIGAFSRELGVDEALKGPLEALSVGTIAKVLLLGAFTGSPGLIVLDEPFAPLDANSRDALTAMIERAASAGAGIVVSSHDEMPSLRGEHLVLRGGKLVARAPGARRWRVLIASSDGTVERVVDAAGRDALLREALDAGHEILAVEERT